MQYTMNLAILVWIEGLLDQVGIDHCCNIIGEKKA
jgi:hypothetical protein